MPSVKTVEKQIRKVEGFDVRMKHPDGRDLRADKEDLPAYNRHERAMKNDATVAEWRDGRFKQIFYAFEVDVLDGRGHPVAGNTKLATVRDSY